MSGLFSCPVSPSVLFGAKDGFTWLSVPSAWEDLNGHTAPHSVLSVCRLWDKICFSDALSQACITNVTSSSPHPRVLLADWPGHVRGAIVSANSTAPPMTPSP